MRETRTGWTTLALVAMVSMLSADESLAAGAARDDADSDAIRPARPVAPRSRNPGRLDCRTAGSRRTTSLRQRVPPFFSAAPLGPEGRAGWVVAGVDGKLHVLNEAFGTRQTLPGVG